MNETDIRAKLLPLMREILALPNLPADARRADVVDWDSLAHMRIIFTVEEDFAVRFSNDDIRAVASVDDLVGVMRRLLPQ